MDDDVCFVIGREIIVNVPIDHRGYTDVYIDDMMGLTIDLPGTRNADRLEASIPLAIKVAAQLNNKNKPIPHKPMVAREKLRAERGLLEKR